MIMRFAVLLGTAFILTACGQQGPASSGAGEHTNSKAGIARAIKHAFSLEGVKMTPDTDIITGDGYSNLEQLDTASNADLINHGEIRCVLFDPADDTTHVDPGEDATANRHFDVARIRVWCQMDFTDSYAEQTGAVSSFNRAMDKFARSVQTT